MSEYEAKLPFSCCTESVLGQQSFLNSCMPRENL